MFLVYISIAAVTAAGGFALTATHFFYKRLKKVSKKTLAPTFGPLAEARGSFAPGSIRGGIASGLLRCTSSRCVRLRRTVATLPPRMNPSPQPPDVARESRSRAAAELTLILLSGEERAVRLELL
jgi:hypothetical protein